MSDTESATPLAALETMLSEPVTVRTKAGQLVHGTLAGYDEHMNLTLTAGSSPDDHETDDAHRLIRGTQVVSITHPPHDPETTIVEPTASSDSEPDAPSPEPAAALAELKAQLKRKNLTVDVGAEEKTLVVTKLGQEYRISPDGTVEGDGPHRRQLEQVLTD